MKGTSSLIASPAYPGKPFNFLYKSLDKPYSLILSTLARFRFALFAHLPCSLSFPCFLPLVFCSLCFCSNSKLAAFAGGLNLKVAAIGGGSLSEVAAIQQQSGGE
jgi:hypothetical protein